MLAVMTSDTLTERRGYVKKSSGLGGSIALLVGIGLLVGVAGTVGLHYAADLRLRPACLAGNFCHGAVLATRSTGPQP